jgi:hypothetical protein
MQNANRLTRVVVAAVILLSTAAAHVETQNTPLIVGTWKLNTEKSKLPPMPAGYFDIRQYMMRADGYLVGLLMTSSPRGYHYLQFTARADGKDYPEYSDDVIAELIASGTPTPRSYAETVIDEYVSEWTDKVNGKVTASGRKTISRDGRTLTITVNGAPAVRVYDRQ